MSISYSHQSYREIKQQALAPSDTALEDALDALRHVCNEQLHLAGIRWTADLQLREAINNVTRVCRQIGFERDVAREQSKKLKDKLNEFERKENDHSKNAREQQSAIVQAIKVRAEKERKQLDRKYKLKLKDGEQKILENAKADYVKMNQELAERMSHHLTQVESAYLISCRQFQHQLKNTLDGFEVSYQDISKRVGQDNNLMKKYQKIVKHLQEQQNELTIQLERYQVSIQKLVENFHKKLLEINRQKQESQQAYVEQHNHEIEEINRKVKDIIERKDKKIAQMGEAIDALNSQLNELTTLPACD